MHMRICQRQAISGRITELLTLTDTSPGTQMHFFPLIYFFIEPNVVSYFKYHYIEFNIYEYTNVIALNDSGASQRLLQVHPTRQDVHRRREDYLIWARTQVFRTTLFVADVEKTLHRRRVRIGRTNDVLRTPGRKKTSGKIIYGPKLGRHLDVTSE